MKFKLFFSLSWLAVLMFTLSGVNAETKLVGGKAAVEFPHRPLYPDVQLISTEDLAKKIGKSVVVDVRSRYEYDTLHIKDARNIPLTDRNFTEELRKIRQSTRDPIVFYCNGKTCAKSYEAAMAAIHARIPETYAYDYGIFAWAKAYPEKTVLLGKTPINVDDLISDEKFKAHVLTPKEFEGKINPSVIVLDVRDLAQRDNMLFPFKEERIPLDRTSKIETLLERVKKENHTLLVYDKAGHQVKWFQYHLESSGIKNYFFMKGGSDGYSQVVYGAGTLESDINKLQSKDKR